MTFMNKNFILVVCLILGFGILFKMHKSKQNYATISRPPAIKDQPTVPKNDPAAAVSREKLDPVQAEMKPSVENPSEVKSAPVAVSREQTVSLQSKNEFLQESFLQMEMPENIPFQKLDLSSEDMSAIYARANGMEMTVVAKKGEVNPRDVEAFLSSADTGIPNLDKRGIKFAPPKNKPPAPGSGMKSAQLYSGLGAHNEEIHVAVFARADGLGTYMFVVSGDASTLESRADDFEKIYGSMKAQPGVK